MYSITPQGSRIALTAQRPEDLVRAFAIAAALGQSYPAQRTINWLSSMTPAYDQTASYWSPYGSISTDDMFVLPWARGGMSYQIGMENYYQFPSALQVDPLTWYAGIRDAFLDAEFISDGALAAFELAADQTDPNGMWGDEVSLRWQQARVAIEKGRMLTDAAKISRKLKEKRHA